MPHPLRIPALRRRAPRLLGLAGLTLLAACGSQSYGGSRPSVPEDSLTMRRVMGQQPEFTPLLPETGNVWPAEEAPRATMANPEALARDPAAPGGPAPLRPRGSSSYPGDQPVAEPPPAARPLPRASRTAPVPVPSPSGETIPVPGGSPVTITGGHSGMQTYVGPNGSTGVAVREGPTINLFGTDGTLRQVPAPR